MAAVCDSEGCEREAVAGVTPVGSTAVTYRCSDHIGEVVRGVVWGTGGDA